MIKKIFFAFLILILANKSFADTASVNNSINNNLPTLQNKTTTNYYQIFSSVMFSKQDVEDISKTLPRFKYLNEFRQEDTNSDKSQITKEGEIKQKSVFNFDEGNIYIYLNSIMYVSKNDWSIWVSGNKITNLTNDNSEIKVLDIFPSLVKLAWTFDLNQWEVINPNKLIPESSYIIKDNAVTLTFSLSPNQSFLPVSNQIIEGKIKEVKVNDGTPQSQLAPGANNKEKSEQTKSFDELFF